MTNTCAVSDGMDPEARTCRLCWGEEERGAGGALVSPCSCCGGLRYIHVQCLHEWQQAQRSRGLGTHADYCELCKARYALGPEQRQLLATHSSWRAQLARRAASALSTALDVRAWPRLLAVTWRGYVMANALLSALRMAASGFYAGLGLGCSVIEVQLGLLDSLVNSAGSLVGWPLEMVVRWQAMGALMTAMASELLYTSMLGLLAGAAYGFCAGYATALRGSASLLLRGGSWLLRASARIAMGLLQHASGVVMRT